MLKAGDKEHWFDIKKHPKKRTKSYWLITEEKANRRASLSRYRSSSSTSLSIGESSETSSFCEIASIADDASTTSMDSEKKMWTMRDLVSTKTSRLIEWTVDQLATVLKKIVARRQAVEAYNKCLGIHNVEEDPMEGPPVLHYSPNAGLIIEEVKDVIHIPKYDTALLLEDAMQDYRTIELPEEVMGQLTNYVTTVTTFYYDEKKSKLPLFCFSFEYY